jgi:eukaryotic-like serine/threonine-protein kinase
MRDPVVGEKLDQYELLDLLARSGMASIFKARDDFSGATVALKVPHIQFESDIVFSQRFEREEQILQKLDHPNVVRLLKPRQKSKMYVVMEYVEGRSLRAIMGHTPLPRDQALEVARQVCQALAYLESAGVVHRDIKPENILLTAEGQVKLIDFGIAMAESERRLTWAGLSTALGTPDYMAPEQIRGRRGDARTDVYALGMLLYEMLTANVPFESASQRALLKLKTSEEPRPPSYHVPGFDPSLEAIIMRAIAREPRDRYPSAAAMLVDLADPSAVPPYDPTALPGRGRGALLPRRLRLGAVVAAVLVGLLALVWASARGGSASAPAPAGARGR